MVHCVVCSVNYGLSQGGQEHVMRGVTACKQNMAGDNSAWI